MRLLGIALALALGGCSAAPTQSAPGPSPNAADPTASAPPSGFDGALLPAGLPPHDFALTDPRGRRVDLRSYRGRVVILTFLSTLGTRSSPLIAQQIRGALDDLERPVPALALTANPAADTPAHIRRFLSEASLLGRLTYLTGPPARLRPIWRAYHVVPVSGSANGGAGGRTRAFDRAATVILIDPQGRERVVFGVEQLTPEGLAHDVQRLQGP